MAQPDPNMRCTCGHRRFRETTTRGTQSIERWVEFDPAAVESFGFGSTPFGTYFGSGTSGTWGLFTGTQHYTDRSLVCESCRRPRSNRRSGGYAIWGTYVSGDKFYLVASDVSDVGCLYIRYTSEDGTEIYEEPVSLSSDTRDPLALPTPVTTSETLPPGALAATTLLEAWLPEVLDYNTFTVALVDRCANRVENLATITLEDTMPTINIKDADLGGAPIEWVNDTIPLDIAGIGQLPGTAFSIPFEKCDAVLEYDARLNTLPTAQGWSHAGSSPSSEWALDAGGVLRANLTGPNYFTRTTNTTTVPSQIWTYSSLFIRDAVGAGIGQGFDLNARIAPGASGSWDGVRMTMRADEWWLTELDGGANVPMATSGDYPEGWFSVAMGRSRNLTPDRGYASVGGVDGGRPFIVDPVAVWGGLAGGPVNPGIYASFGLVTGTSVDGWLRNYVVSAPGRFLRPLYRSTAPGSTGVLRLYLSADNEPSSPQTLARFRVKYGSYVTGSSPFSLPSTVVEQTITFPTKNQIVEANFSLAGMTPRAPMWFTIERDWSHVDDLIRSTVRLFDVTLRAS